MIEGTLNECRRAAELIIAQHAANIGYTPEDLHEEILPDGRRKAVWMTPDEKMQVVYCVREEVAPLSVDADMLAASCRRVERIKAFDGMAEG